MFGEYSVQCFETADISKTEKERRRKGGKKLRLGDPWSLQIPLVTFCQKVTSGNSTGKKLVRTVLAYMRVNPSWSPASQTGHRKRQRRIRCVFLPGSTRPPRFSPLPRALGRTPTGCLSCSAGGEQRSADPLLRSQMGASKKPRYKSRAPDAAVLYSPNKETGQLQKRDDIPDQSPFVIVHYRICCLQFVCTAS